MEKTNRVLILFYRLLQDERINKEVFAAEYGLTMRSVERYIKEIRILLQQVNDEKHLVFDRKERVYYLR